MDSPLGIQDAETDPADEERSDDGNDLADCDGGCEDEDPSGMPFHAKCCYH